MPWEISVLAAGASLLVLAVVAVAAAAEIRRACRSAAQLGATLDRHVPAIRQNLDEITRHADALSASLRALRAKASETADGFDRIVLEIRHLERDLREGLVEPMQRLAAGVSALLAVVAALRSLRHPFRRRRRGQGGT
ncbi:MAG TPA: hypothetical protein PKN59_04190 [Syntrophales bacterium]|nr:hypothetical protein [Syntrophales bacterium]HNS53773.1 hypothetical protein [Syntrophales bacterium]